MVRSARPRIGLGLAALGRPGYINLGHADDVAARRDASQLEAHAHSVLAAAYAAGVRDFDAARSYGRAEAFLASFLASQKIAPGSLCISSKWGYRYTADWRVDVPVHEVKDHTLAAYKEQWPQTRALLGEHLTLYQIHSLTPESPALADKALHAALLERKAQGLAIGFSTSGPQQAAVIHRAIDLRPDGVRLFDSVQATYNLLETSAEAALAEAHAAGLTVMVKEALANGRLSERNRDAAFAAKLQRLRQHASALAVGVDALAIAAVLRRPWVDVVLSGAATPVQLHANLRAYRVDPAAIAELPRNLAEASEEYWRTRAALPWN
jgi:aryl-alcohol dehydrogenase-like predicted oxidoreductase